MKVIDLDKYEESFKEPKRNTSGIEYAVFFLLFSFICLIVCLENTFMAIFFSIPFCLSLLYLIFGEIVYRLSHKDWKILMKNKKKKPKGRYFTELLDEVCSNVPKIRFITSRTNMCALLMYIFHNLKNINNPHIDHNIHSIIHFTYKGNEMVCKSSGLSFQNFTIYCPQVCSRIEGEQHKKDEEKKQKRIKQQGENILMLFS